MCPSYFFGGIVKNDYFAWTIRTSFNGTINISWINMADLKHFLGDCCWVWTLGCLHSQLSARRCSVITSILMKLPGLKSRRESALISAVSENMKNISADQRCFRVREKHQCWSALFQRTWKTSVLISAVSEYVKNISADQRCFRVREKHFRENQLWISVFKRWFP